MKVVIVGLSSAAKALFFDWICAARLKPCPSLSMYEMLPASSIIIDTLLYSITTIFHSILSVLLVTAASIEAEQFGPHSFAW
jgi:hypothetical protein